jgi:hypothetical protein
MTAVPFQLWSNWKCLGAFKASRNKGSERMCRKVERCHTGQELNVESTKNEKAKF